MKTVVGSKAAISRQGGGLVKLETWEVVRADARESNNVGCGHNAGAATLDPRSQT